MGACYAYLSCWIRNENHRNIWWFYEQFMHWLFDFLWLRLTGHIHKRIKSVWSVIRLATFFRGERYRTYNRCIWLPNLLVFVIWTAYKFGTFTTGIRGQVAWTLTKSNGQKDTQQIPVIPRLGNQVRLTPPPGAETCGGEGQDFALLLLAIRVSFLEKKLDQTGWFRSLKKARFLGGWIDPTTRVPVVLPPVPLLRPRNRQIHQRWCTCLYRSRPARQQYVCVLPE